jgi:hypothetical protein
MKYIMSVAAALAGIVMSVTLILGLVRLIQQVL